MVISEADEGLGFVGTSAVFHSIQSGEVTDFWGPLGGMEANSGFTRTLKFFANNLQNFINLLLLNLEQCTQNAFIESNVRESGETVASGHTSYTLTWRGKRVSLQHLMSILLVKK